MCEMSGYGQTGPLSKAPAYDGIIQAMTGMMATTGKEHPTRIGVLVGDIGTAMAGTIAVLGSLLARERTGLGEYIDLAMYDTLLSMLEAKFLQYTIMGKDTVRTGNRYPHLAPLRFTRNRRPRCAHLRRLRRHLRSPLPGYRPARTGPGRALQQHDDPPGQPRGT